MGKNFYDPAFDGTRQIIEAKTIPGIPYSGEMVVSPAERDGHLIAWKTTAGNYEGIGLVIEGRLYLAFGTEGYGLAVYSETADGLEAFFTSQAFKGAAGKEKVLACKGFGHLDQTYRTQGWQPDNIAYQGNLAFVAYGDLFLMTWAFDGQQGQLVGVGMVRNERLVTAYGFHGDYTFGCGCYELASDGGLKGEWAIPSFPKTGKELYGKSTVSGRAPG